MPSSLTHYWFAKDVVNRYKSDLDFLNNNQYKYLTYVGTQGPDILFFYGIPRKRIKTKEIQAYGSHLHKEGSGEKFIKMLEYMKSYSGNKEPLYAYLFGAMLHYCLDRRAHAFVFYRTGFQLKNEPIYHFSSDHCRYEAYMDTALLTHYHTSPYIIKAWKVVSADETLMKQVSKMYAYKEDLEEATFYDGWKDMVLAEHLLLDRSHLKRGLMSLIGLKHSVPYAMVHKDKLPNDGVDYLNLSHEMWANPATNEKHQESFLEIFDGAFEETHIVVDIIKKAMNGKDVTKDIQKFCSEINYEGICVDQEMKYYKSIYKKEVK